MLQLENVTDFTSNEFFFSENYFCILIYFLSDSPVFISQPHDVTGDSGDRVTLECLVDSNPPGQYTWIRNNLASKTKVRSVYCVFVRVSLC